EIMAELGYTELEEFIGRPNVLTQRETDHEKAKHLDLSAVIAEPAGEVRTKVREQAHTDIEELLDWDLIDEAAPAIEDGAPVAITRDVRNVDRAVGATLSNRVVSEHGGEGLPADTVSCRFDGQAGQSFGAFLAPGVSFRVVGDANDYLGKGLSGGKIIVVPPKEASIVPHENTICGNVILYGATSGEIYLRGMVGERFAIRNSGAKAVVEGVGDHGCEYMTGGVVVVLGTTGYNFAAGMSGGIAYVYDESEMFETRCNLDMVDLESVWEKEDVFQLRTLIENHYKYTNSGVAQRILDKWVTHYPKFVKVMPVEYRKVLQRMKEAEFKDSETVSVTEEVFNG
ncbi:MAG: glutamate synthase subunit alpha, partial [Candidatus Sumerlaeota bacterium]